MPDGQAWMNSRIDGDDGQMDGRLDGLTVGWIKLDNRLFLHSSF